MFNFARRLFCLCYSYTCALLKNVIIKCLNFKTYVSRLCAVLLFYKCLLLVTKVTIQKILCLFSKVNLRTVDFVTSSVSSFASTAVLLTFHNYNPLIIILSRFQVFKRRGFLFCTVSYVVSLRLIVTDVEENECTCTSLGACPSISCIGNLCNTKLLVAQPQALLLKFFHIFLPLSTALK